MSAWPATLFLVFPRFEGEGRQEILTHFLSTNPCATTFFHTLNTVGGATGDHRLQ